MEIMNFVLIAVTLSVLFLMVTFTKKLLTLDCGLFEFGGCTVSSIGEIEVTSGEATLVDVTALISFSLTWWEEDAMGKFLKK